MTTDTHANGGSRRSWVLIALGLVALVVVAAALFASSDPDGLEQVAEDIGFIGAGEGSPFSLGFWKRPGIRRQPVFSAGGTLSVEPQVKPEGPSVQIRSRRTA